MHKILAALVWFAIGLAAQGATDGILGPFDTVERLSFGFQDTRPEVAQRDRYTLALSREEWPPSPKFYITINNVKIVDKKAVACMEKCYALATEAIRSFRTNPAKSPRGIENFMAISIGGQPAGITLSFWKGALKENPKLAELQSALESMLTLERETAPDHPLEPTPTTATPAAGRPSRQP